MNKDEVLKKYVMRCTVSSVYNYTQRFGAVTNVVEIFQGDPNEVGKTPEAEQYVLKIG